MKIVEIPIASSASHFMQENDIFGQTFFLEFEWIENQQFWFLHVANDQEQPLISGIKLQPHWPIFKECHAKFSLMLLPKGNGMVLDHSTLHNNFSLVAYETL